MGNDAANTPSGEGSSGSALGPRSRAILAMIAAGHTYDQILHAYPDFTYNDIFAAADEALKLSEGSAHKAGSIADIRIRHPRAYETWTAEEEQRLRGLLEVGHTVAQIAGILQRQRGAVRSRINKLALFELLNPKEQARFLRIEHRDGRVMSAEDKGVGDGK